MPLTLDEVTSLTPEAEAVGKALADGFRKDPDGKVRLTKKELRRIGLATYTLGRKLFLETLD